MPPAEQASRRASAVAHFVLVRPLSLICQMNVGYSISGEDNDSYMCASCDRVFAGMHGLRVCPTCNYRTDFAYTSSTFRLSRHTFDLSYTYDGACIVSQRFRDFCVRHGFEALEFRSLPATPGFFHFLVHRTVAFDTETRGTRFERWCATCQCYESVVGATPAFLKTPEPLPEGFFCSDVLFGSGNAKSALLLVGSGTKTQIEQERFRGITYKEANGLTHRSSEWPPPVTAAAVAPAAPCSGHRSPLSR
jgi:hypothetical protein